MDDIDAPIAEPENDSISDNEKTNDNFIDSLKLRRSLSNPLDISIDSALSISLEDLITTFDEKVYRCFQDFGNDTALIAPVSSTPKNKDFPGNYEGYDASMEFQNTDWTKMTDLAHKRSENGTINLVTTSAAGEAVSLQSAEGLLMEIQEMMDMSDNNADFEGIEESFYDSDMSESVKDVVVAFQAEWSGREGCGDWVRALSGLGAEALRLLTSEMRGRVRTLSDCLLIHLASRDELEFEREVRDRFVLLLQGVHVRKREAMRQLRLRLLLQQRRHNPASMVPGNGSSTICSRQGKTNRNRWSWNGNWSSLLFRSGGGSSQSSSIRGSGSRRPMNDENNNEGHEMGSLLAGEEEEEDESLFGRSLKTSRLTTAEDPLARLSEETGLLHQSCCPTQPGRDNLRNLENTVKYLSTTIPFHPGNSSASLHHLQIFNKILLAVLQENSKVDRILTDYILNVYAVCVDKSSHQATIAETRYAVGVNN